MEFRGLNEFLLIREHAPLDIVRAFLAASAAFIVHIIRIKLVDHVALAITL